MFSHHPPGPPGNLLLGNLLDLVRRPIPFVEEAARCGDLAHFRLGPLHAYLAVSPAHVGEVLLKQAPLYPRDPLSKRQAGKFVGECMALVDGEAHRFSRRLVQPAFHNKRLEAYAAVMETQARAMLAGWRAGAVVDVGREMQAVTLKVACETLFGADTPVAMDEVARAMADFEEVLAVEARAALPLPDWLPIERKRRMRRSIRALDGLVAPIIRARRASGQRRDDLLGMLLSAVDAGTGARFTEKQAHDEAVFLFIAGHESTAGTLTWVFHLLDRHPEVEAQVLRELDEVLGDRPPTGADLPRLPYLEKVVKETLRLYPPAWLFARAPSEDVRLGGYPIRAGSLVFLSPFVTQRDPRHFDRPGCFWPERFTADFEASLPRYAYFPFGVGPHACLGQHFAMAEIRLVVATVLRRFHLRATTPEAVQPSGLALLQTDRPVRMRLVPRAGAAGAPA